MNFIKYLLLLLYFNLNGTNNIKNMNNHRKYELNINCLSDLKDTYEDTINLKNDIENKNIIKILEDSEKIILSLDNIKKDCL
jgi:hypothetical protein